MVFNTSSAEVIDKSLSRSTHYALIRQLLFAFTGILSGYGAYSLGMKQFIKMSFSLLVLSTILLILVFIPGIGQQINGAHRWINIFGNSLQPSEFAKILIPAFFIERIMRRENSVDFVYFLKILLIISVPLFLILIEPDNGSVAIIMASLIAVFILTKLKASYWVLPLCVLLVGGGILASQMKHVPDRIRVYLHPELDIKGKGHQPYQAKIATGSGRIFGKGLGESLQKLDYLPEARNDYIAAIYAEEMGFIGVCVLIFLYGWMAFWGFYMAMKAQSREEFAFTAVLTFLLSLQAFLNLGVVSGLLPSKGVNLPFFSQGGSSLLANSVVIGLILRSQKKTELKQQKAKVSTKVLNKYR